MACTTKMCAACSNCFKCIKKCRDLDDFRHGLQKDQQSTEETKRNWKTYKREKVETRKKFAHISKVGSMFYLSCYAMKLKQTKLKENYGN